MSTIEFELPEELRGVTEDSILADMLARLKKPYDTTEGGFVHDMVAPSALEAAELIQFWLVLALQMNFHMWAKGRWLDYHAANCGLVRRPATCAYGDVEVVTTQAVTFPAGFIFSVPSENGSTAIDFETTEEYSTAGAGTLTLRVKAVESGVNSNVAADTITIMKNPVRGVESISNLEDMTGGTAAEDDTSLRQRITDFYAGRGASFVGNRKDYERWAKQVAGVGYALCIPNFFKAWQSTFTVKDRNGNEVEGDLQIVAGDASNELKIIDVSSTTRKPHTLTGTIEYTGKNSVKLVICDADGNAAPDEMLEAVDTHIFGTGHEDLERLAPIGLTKWEVAAPTLIDIPISLNAKLAEDYTAEVVKENIVAALKKHFKTLADDENVFGTLYYVKVSSVLTTCAGLEDFKNLLVNGGEENISFAADEMPTINVDLVTLLEY